MSRKRKTNFNRITDGIYRSPWPSLSSIVGFRSICIPLRLPASFERLHLPKRKISGEVESPFRINEPQLCTTANPFYQRNNCSTSCFPLKVPMIKKKNVEGWGEKPEQPVSEIRLSLDTLHTIRVRNQRPRISPAVTYQASGSSSSSCVDIAG